MSLKLNFRSIMIILSVVVVVELLWAGWTLYKPSSNKALPADATTVTLSASKLNPKVGESVTVTINISSIYKTVGTDLVIKYDPKLLTVKTDANKNPVTVGSLYSDYPANVLEENMGRISVSGITDADSGVSPNGLFGQIAFQAKAAGTTVVSFDFAPGKTNDSNIIDIVTKKDVLEGVNNLQLKISP